jgi:hypothetical protein
MLSRLFYSYLRLLTKLNYFSHLLFIFLVSFFECKNNKPINSKNIKNIYLGNKIFSNCEVRTQLKFELIDISVLKDYRFDNSLLILNNNDFSNEYCFNIVSKIKKKSTNLQIYIWDFDNHHAIANSMRMLYLADIYFAAHQHNFDLLRRASPSFFGILPASVIQWPKEYLTNSFDKILYSPRSNELFGMHFYYSSFDKRNKIIESVSKNFPNVCFSNTNYHNRTIDNRFAEWCHYKVHFIVPVDNDLPIRLFDALITGGIPLVPIKMKSLLYSLTIDHFVVYYDELDLDLLHLKVKDSIIKFDKDGVEGMKKRINFIIENHHIDSRANFLINLSY